MSATCRSCSAPILWVLTESGKTMPIDDTPYPDGNIVLLPAADPRDAPTAVTLNKGGTYERPGSGLLHSPPAGQRFKSHFATCPQADSHRRKA